MRWPVLLFHALLVGPAFASDLEDFMSLNEKLPGAVCDETMIARAPTLTPSSTSGIEAWKHQKNWSVEAQTQEVQVLSFLLGNAQSMIAAPYFAAQRAALTGSGGTAKELTELRRRISLGVCTALVTPGKMKSLMAETPHWFFSARLEEEKAVPRLLKGSGRAVFRIQDSEGRFGQLGGRWWVPGWIELQEVISVAIEGRRYRRLAHPITNGTRWIEISGDGDLPLGFIYPKPSNAVASTTVKDSRDWKTLEAQADSEASRQRQIESYRLSLEIEAYRLATLKPGLSESVRKLQEFYKSLLSAYQLYPEDPQFAVYAKKSGKISTLTDTHRLLDSEFFRALDAAHASVSLFKPNPKLHGLFREYQERLAKLRAP